MTILKFFFFLAVGNDKELLLRVLTLKSLWLSAENYFRNEFMVAFVSLNGLTRGLKVVFN